MQSIPQKRFTISLPMQVLLGAILGIIAGVFFGRYCAVLRPIGTIYTMLLQAAVYPYIICTLLSGLGRLSRATAVDLFKRGWSIYVLLLVLTFAVIITLDSAIPITNIALQSGLNKTATSSNLLDLLIPANIFSALANNYVPAVAIFCILFGVMLQHVKEKQSLLQALNAMSETCIHFWNWLVKLAPYAVFTLLAVTAGTVKYSQFKDLSEYIILFFIGTLILTFWIMPITISAMTGVEYKIIMRKLRAALIIAAATTLSVVALPYIYKVTTELLNHKDIEQKDRADSIINTTLLISYPFAQVGNFFISLFILFAALYFNHPLQTLQQWLLPAATYLSSIGSPSTAVNAVDFLSEWLKLPTDTTAFYVGMTPITRYGQVLASVMGIAFITIIITFAYFGRLRCNFKKLITHLVLAAILLIAFAIIFKHLIPNQGVKIYQRLDNTSLAPEINHNLKITMMPVFDEKQNISAKNAEDVLYSIQKTGVLRVGYNATMKPFVFFNNKKQLVGYDVAYIYELAHSLDLQIQFIPYTWQELVNDLQANKFDIAIGAIYVSEPRLQKVAFTTPYIKSPAALIVKQNRETEFRSIASIHAIAKLRIGVFNDPVLIPLIQNNFPNAQIIILTNFTSKGIEEAFAAGKIDAVFWSQAQTNVWALGHPGYVSISPNGIAAPFLISYMINNNSPQFLNFLNYWLRLKENDGFQQSLYDKWILARPTPDSTPRWSIVNNILHWQ